MSLLGSLRPSERRFLKQYALDNETRFIADLKAYLSGWEDAKWVELYNIERVAEWVSKHCPASTIEAASQLAKSQLMARTANNDNGATLPASRASAYATFLTHLR